MTKVGKGGGGTVNMWSLNQKIPGLVFVKPKDIKLSDCGLSVDETLPYAGASPDRILLCSCSEKASVEIKCPYSIN